MCGVVGEVRVGGNDNWVANQTVQMQRRGPDDQKTLALSPNLFMGVARLAMTDPHPRSAQPMIDSQTGNAISFNGEIYNYKELRESLLEQGLKFETESDTEVLLKLLGAKGFRELHKLNGMYSFVFFSRRENRLYFGRDKLGKKPLYVSKSRNSLRWSSCLHSFYEKNRTQEIADGALIQYLSLGYILDPTTVKSNVEAVNPGEVISFDLDLLSFEVCIKTSSTGANLGMANSGESLRSIIKVSVGDRIEGHENVALSLSGGVDSAIIAVELAEKVINTCAFTAVWSDSDKTRYNVDASLAAKIATKLGLSLQSVEMLKANQVADGVRDFLIAMEEPNNNPSGVSMMNLYSQIARSGFRLALTGDGADEIFGGYARHSSSSKLPNLFHFKSTRIIENAYDDSSQKNNILKRLISSQIAPESPLSWLQWHWAFNPREISRVLRLHNEVRDYSTYMCNSILSLDSEISLKNPMAMMKRDHEIWLSMESNRKLDRISMFNSIEARSPFQDNRIIGWAREKFSTEGKRQLNKVDLWNAYPELNSLGVRKDKAGFTSPVGHWLRKNPQLVSSSLSFLAKDGRFRSEGLMYLSDAPQRGKYRELMQLWTLVVLSTWLQLNW